MDTSEEDIQYKLAIARIQGKIVYKLYKMSIKN